MFEKLSKFQIQIVQAEQRKNLTLINISPRRQETTISIYDRFGLLHMFSVAKKGKRCSNVEDESLYTSNTKDKMFCASLYIFSHVFVTIRHSIVLNLSF